MVAAFRAVPAFPRTEGRIRAAAVVGVEHPVDDLEKVGQAAGLQCPPQDKLGFSFTQAIIHDVRVRDFGPGLGTAWVEGLHPKRCWRRVGVLRFPVQGDAKRSQVHFFQLDRFGHH